MPNPSQDYTEQASLQGFPFTWLVSNSQFRMLDW